MGERRHDEGIDDARLMSILDPAANARALGEIQRRGLRAAGELVDRLIGGIDGGQHDRPSTRTGTSAAETADVGGANGSPSGAPSSLGGSATGSPPADLLHLWMDVFQRGLQAMAAMARLDGVPTPGNGSIATADVGRGAVTGAVHIRVGVRSDVVSAGSVGHRGRTGATEVWLHNGTSEARSGLRLHTGDLRTHDGATLSTSSLRFDPPSLDDLPARSSRGIVVVANVADGVPSGVYRGVLLVAGAADVWLPIAVTVASGE